MKRNLEEEIETPSPVNTLIYVARKNPLFKEALDNMKTKEDKEAFALKFKEYLLNAYKEDPKIKRLMKSHDLASKVMYAPEDEDHDSRSMLDSQLYSEQGRTYHYTNNLLGEERDKKGLLKKLYQNTKDFTRETFPGIIGLGGASAASKWHAGAIARDALQGTAAQQGAKAAKAAVKGLFEGTKWYQPGKLIRGLIKAPATGAVAGAAGTAAEVASDSLLSLAGTILTPAKYLLGGYFLYKTIKYFVNKHKEKKNLKELNKKVWVQNQMLAQAA